MCEIVIANLFDHILSFRSNNVTHGYFGPHFLPCYFGKSIQILITLHEVQKHQFPVYFIKYKYSVFEI